MSTSDSWRVGAVVAFAVVVAAMLWMDGVPFINCTVCREILPDWMCEIYNCS